MVKIIADTTSCLTPEFSRRWDIPIIPQVINFGSESFLEGIDIDLDTFMHRLRTSTELPKTAAPPPELFAKEFERLVPTGDTILCIHPSTEVSGTVRSAIVAAQDFPNADIRVIDTRLVSSPLGTIIELAAEWARQGMPADEIVTQVLDWSKRCHIYFMVDTLEYLAKGGRIGGAASLLGSVLQIKPILKISDGKVDQYERERTHKRGVARMKELVKNQAPLDGSAHISVMYAGNKPEVQGIAQELSIMIGQEHIPVVHVPPAIITHGGPGIIGVGFFVK